MATKQKHRKNLRKLYFLLLGQQYESLIVSHKCARLDDLNNSCLFFK